MRPADQSVYLNDEMLGSLKSSSSSSHDVDEYEPSDHDLHLQTRHPSSSSATATHQLRRLLLTSAELIAHSDLAAAARLVAVLSANSTPYGDSTQRLAHQFLIALSVRIRRLNPNADLVNNNAKSVVTSNDVWKEQVVYRSLEDARLERDYCFETCYLWMNQMTPFIRFSHLSANQAILDAAEADTNATLHILDLDLLQGLQWPPLMQALIERSDKNAAEPPFLRITGCGHNLMSLNQTGERLSQFAQSLGLRLQFHPLVVNIDEPPAHLALLLCSSALSLVPGEALVVNAALYLHKLVSSNANANTDDDDQPYEVKTFLRALKALNPRIVTVAEREANHSEPEFLRRFAEAVDHYGAVFDSLEATVPPSSRERLTLEEGMFGREILDIVAARGRERRQRHKKFEVWEAIFRELGFQTVPLSAFAYSQAKLLLRLHYPSQGYQLQFVKDTLFLGWQNRLLFSVSSWR